MHLKEATDSRNRTQKKVVAKLVNKDKRTVCEGFQNVNCLLKSALYITFMVKQLHISYFFSSQTFKNAEQTNRWTVNLDTTEGWTTRGISLKVFRSTYISDTKYEIFPWICARSRVHTKRYKVEINCLTDVQMDGCILHQV